MYAVSDRFKSTVVNGGADWIVTADVQVKKQNVVSDLEVIDGNVSVDSTASIRRTSSIDLLPEDHLIPRTSTDVLFPVGNELILRSGFRWSDGTEELVPSGVFRISKPQWGETDDSGLFMRVNGYDRSRAVARAGFTRPWTIQSGTPLENAIQDIVMRVFPWFTEEDFLFIETGYVTPKIILEVGDDPWQTCTELAAAAGAEVLFDSSGRSVLRDVPDPVYADPSWRFIEGEGCTLLDLGGDLDDEQAYNGCVAVGQNTTDAGPPVRAVVWDTDPLSPTYWDPAYPGLSSAYGPVPFFYQSEYLRTQEQCTKAAWGQLKKHLGVLQKVDFTAIPNPAQEEGDVVEVQREAVKIDTHCVVDQLQFNLGLGSEMVVNTRERRVVPA